MRLPSAIRARRSASLRGAVTWHVWRGNPPHPDRIMPSPCAQTEHPQRRTADRGKRSSACRTDIAEPSQQRLAARTAKPKPKPEALMDRTRRAAARGEDPQDQNREAHRPAPATLNARIRSKQILLTRSFTA